MEPRWNLYRKDVADQIPAIIDQSLRYLSLRFTNRFRTKLSTKCLTRNMASGRRAVPHLMVNIVPAVDAGDQVDVAYFDFRKAFDTVDHDVLLVKLANASFTPHTLTFFASYMSNRRQYVDCTGHLSEPYFTKSDVSQGSNLGPLEFILMINDLLDNVKDSVCLLFADDLKLFRIVNDSSDCTRIKLQEDIPTSGG